MAQTKKTSRDHSALSEIYANQILGRCNQINEDLHRIYRTVGSSVTTNRRTNSLTIRSAMRSMQTPVFRNTYLTVSRLYTLKRKEEENQYKHFLTIKVKRYQRKRLKGKNPLASNCLFFRTSSRFFSISFFLSLFSAAESAMKSMKKS